MDVNMVSLYRCLSCGQYRICEYGNHHPWCLRCMDDQFDWSSGYENMTREASEKLQDTLNE
jgi:hypothetical protein